MRILRLRTDLELTLGVVLVGALGLILHQYWQLASLRGQRDANLQSIRLLQEALRQHDQQQAPVPVEAPTPASDDRGTLARHAATIQQLNHELSEAHTSAAQFQAQLANSRDEREKALASAEERYRNQQADLETRLDALQQKLDSAEAESQASRQRIRALEADNTKLRNDGSEGSTRAAEFERVAASLQDLDRRRDTYLMSISRRYRDVTSQFRAMGGMLDSSRDASSSACSSEALGRIQNTVSQADDDLRQLNELNAQARQLEKKLAKK
jgi:chromosome segregation ATPase